MGWKGEYTGYITKIKIVLDKTVNKIKVLQQKMNDSQIVYSAQEL